MCSDWTKKVLVKNPNLDEVVTFNNGKIITNGITEYLGKEFMELWCTVKQAEYQSVHSQITSIEKSWDI